MESKITSIHPKVLDAITATITEARARGMAVALHSGLRTADEQQKLWELGRITHNPDGASLAKPMGNIVTNARAYESWHNFGLAGDIVFKDAKGFTWDVAHEKWKALGDVGKIYGLEWGGDWPKFPDLPHFQMRGKIKDVHEAKNILYNQGAEALWAMI